MAKRRAKPIVSRSGSSPARLGEARLARRVDAPELVRVELPRRRPVRLVGRRLGTNAGGAEQLGQVGIEPGAEVDAVRDVADRRVLAELAPHLARDVAVQVRDAVRLRREAERERREAEAALVAEAAEGEQLLGREAGCSGEPTDVAGDELLAEDLVAGRRRACAW